MSVVVALSGSTLQGAVPGARITLVDWRAEWWAPAARFTPVFAAASQRHRGIRFGQVDTGAEWEVPTAAQIPSIPTLPAVRGGVLVFSQSDPPPPAAAAPVIRAGRNVDMADVRRHVEGQSTDRSAQGAAS